MLSEIIKAIAKKIKMVCPDGEIYIERTQKTNGDPCFFINLDEVQVEHVLFSRQKYTCSFDITCLLGRILPVESDNMSYYVFGSKLITELMYISVNENVFRLLNLRMQNKSVTKNIQGLSMRGDKELHIYFDIEFFGIPDENGLFENMEKLKLEVTE